jgi:hypothetical protein
MNRRNTAAFKGKRVTRSYYQTINADSSKVFSLICPVKEAEWLDGWDYELMYSESGVAEEGCVFISRTEGEQDTVWVITKRDAERKETEFARITPGSRVAMVRVSIKDTGEGKSGVSITYTITALSEEGSAFIDNFTEDHFAQDMKFWEATMNHYIETGRALPHPNRKNWLKYKPESERD